jgi:predicted nicotinamide N-methyase
MARLDGPPGGQEREPALPWRDLVEEPVVLRGRTIRIVRPRDSVALLDEEAFGREEFLPYWAQLWPSAVALARAVAARELADALTVELGCGLGLPSLAAAAAGARVLATDWSADAVAFAATNAARNHLPVSTAVCSWSEPGPILARAPWDLVLASDVLYEERNVAPLLALLPRLVGPGGEVLLADPGRRHAGTFLAAAAPAWQLDSAADPRVPGVRVHRLRPGPASPDGASGPGSRPAGPAR